MAKTLPYLIVIGGPTAAGKTALSIALAKALKTEVINADSRQFYREMKIGTARPGESELDGVPHHFLGDRSITESLNAGAFARQALEQLKELFSSHDYVILSGGSGLFVKALTEGLDHFPEVPPTVRSEVDALYQEKGIIGLQAALAEKDPDYLAVVDQQNPARLRRALEVIKVSGRPFSSFQQQEKEKRPFQCIYLAAFRPRAELYHRIDQRVDRMMETGLLAEVKSLLPDQDLPVLKTLGYQELFAHLRGEYSLERAIALIKQGSRRYAKRQTTWLRRDGFWKLIDPENTDEALKYLSFVEQHQLRLHSRKGDPGGSLEYHKEDQVLASITYHLGKKASIAPHVQISADMPEEAIFWIQQEAERRLKQ